MQFAIINDIHNGPAGSGMHQGVQRKLTTQAEPLMSQFVREMNDRVKPAFVVNLGDLIEDVNDHDIDLDYLRRTHGILAQLAAPLHTLIGNHDVRTLTEDEISAVIGQKSLHYSFDHDGLHFVMLSFVMTGSHTTDLSDIKARVSDDQISWLQNDLANTTKPTLIFIHYGLAEDDMKGSFWFEEEPHYALLNNRVELRKIFADSGKVRAVFSGHQHWNRMSTHDNIPYFVVTSLIENFNNDGIAAAAHTLVTLEKDSIIVEVKGNDPARFEYRFARHF